MLNRSKHFNSPLGPRQPLLVESVVAPLVSIIRINIRNAKLFGLILEIQKHFIPSHFNKKSYNWKYDKFQSNIKFGIDALSQTQIF